MSLADSYTREIRHELKRFATWEPGVPLRLGDYGTRDGSRFDRIGNLSDLGITFEKRGDPSGKQISYKSKGSVEENAGAGAAASAGLIARVKAALKISFESQYAILFNAADVSYESVTDQRDLQRQLLRLLESGEWDPSHVVVTELTRSGATTVAVSSGSSGSLLLEAEGDVAKVDLADANLRLSIKEERNIGYRLIGEKGMTPLLGLSRIRPSGIFWWQRAGLLKERGFEREPGGPEPDSIPRQFQATLDEHLDTLVDATRAGEAPVEEAFEWAELQPRERPQSSSE